jgi:hypothetical protein
VHPEAPYTDITFSGVFWNDPVRVAALLDAMRPWFRSIVVGVQSVDPSTDPTVQVCQERADDVLLDRVHGHCEPTIEPLLRRVATRWTFLVSGDEMPTVELLEALPDCIRTMDTDGWYVPFRSSIEGRVYASEADNHLRLFLTTASWPRTNHSEPRSERPRHLRTGWIAHDRSLDELVEDYLRYYALGRGNAGWDAHNRMMLHDAITATATHVTGWSSLGRRGWWGRAVEPAFGACRDRCSLPGGYDCGMSWRDVRAASRRR